MTPMCQSWVHGVRCLHVPTQLAFLDRLERRSQGVTTFFTNDVDLILEK